MNDNVAGVIFVVTLVLALVVSYRFLGDHLWRTYASSKHLRVERVVYKTFGVDPDAEQTWTAYLRSVLAFSAVSVLLLYLILRLQHHSLLSWHNPYDVPAMVPHQSFNTAVSFTTNTNWQSYSGENGLGYWPQMLGLTVQNFASAAVAIAVAIAFVRGFARNRTAQLGNFWVDLTRTIVRVLLPLAVVIAVLFLIGGAVQGFHPRTTVTTLAGGSQSIQTGATASQEAIKQVGTNGGGIFNANSSHPFENPTTWTNWLQIFTLLVIPFSLPRTFGRMVGDLRQGRAIVLVMATLAVVSLAVVAGAQIAHHGTVPTSVGAATEGTEVRFGVPQSSVFATATTLTSTGAVDSFHDSYTSLGGMQLIINMAIGEVAPGGTGSGLYGLLILAVVSVFVAGLMVGRTPEYLGKKISAREMKFASLYILTTPALVLIGTAVAVGFNKVDTLGNPGFSQGGTSVSGSHGLSEIIYAFTSAGNNNGSAFAGITVSTGFYDTALAIVMLFGRFLPMIFVLGLAGSLARQQPVPAGEGTLPTHRLQFIGLVIGVTVIVVALTYFPALALGPLAEAFH